MDAATVQWTSGEVLAALPLNTEDALKSKEASLSTIVLMCLTMCGTIGILWALLWTASWAWVGNVGGGSLHIALLAMTWASTSLSMHVLNKSLVTKLHSPALISAVQMALAAICMSVTALPQLANVPKRQVMIWLVVPCVFAGMLVTSMYAYKYISLSLLTIVRNLAPLVALPIEYVVMPPGLRPAPTLPAMASILVMLTGAMIYGNGQDESVLAVGVGFAVLNMIVAVCDRLIQRRLLTTECKDMPSSLCTMISNTAAILPTMAFATATGQVQQVSLPAQRAEWQEANVLLLLLLSGLIGLGTCYFGIECQRALSATSFLVMQNASKIAVVGAGVLFFGDPIHPLAIAGLSLSLGGSFLYGFAQEVLQKHHQAEQEEKAEVPTK